MSVASGAFLLFLLVTLIVFYAFPERHRWLVLLGASIVFYAMSTSWSFLWFAVTTTFAAWVGTEHLRDLDREQKELLANKGLSRDEKKAIRESFKPRRRATLITVLVIGIGLLVVTKFYKFVWEYVNVLIAGIPGHATLTAQAIVMPLGISYYTFSTIGYVLDVYWKRREHEENYLRLFLYAIYFPHILQGPISRYGSLGEQLKKDLVFDGQNIFAGSQLMIYGFFKKLVIADRLNLFVSAIYDGRPHAGSAFIVAMFLDALMIYTDFSGYTDIVRGASQCFGVELEENFRRPFFSRSVAEFWRRWHMTLGGWFKDYVYYPISVAGWMKKFNRKNAKRLPKRVARTISVAVPCLVTWFLTGLWHGTGIGYVCWGLYYGTLITISVAFQEDFKAFDERMHIKVDGHRWRLFQMLRTFLIFMGGRVLTSPGGLDKTAMVFDNIFHNLQPWQWLDGTIWTYGINATNGFLLLICFAVLLGVSYLQERMNIREELAKRPVALSWALMYLGIFVVMIYGVYGAGYDASRFIYMQF